ncbi:MAG: GNAT family N-acetyltransferase [Pseudomonadota bacterium]
MQLHDLGFADLNTAQLLALLRLRVDVFVVEQDCPYPEIDGLDDEPQTRHIFLAHDDHIMSYLRLLGSAEGERIGRVVTAPNARGEGLSARLIRHAMATSSGPWVLHAQAHLAAWYARFGFAISGTEFLEDGILHVPMQAVSASKSP